MDYRKFLINQISRKTAQLESSLFYADGRTDGKTDMTKLTVAVRIL